jgi:hypothetical protein
MNDPATEYVFRLLLGFALIGGGVFTAVRPKYVSSIERMFRGDYPNLGWEFKVRLSHVLEARVRAESINTRLTRILGILAALTGVVELIPTVPMLLPYAIGCVALAFQILAIFLQVRGVTTRRVASLAPRRTPIGLPPVLLIGAALCLAGTAGFAVKVMLPVNGLSAVFVLLSMVVMFMVAYRIAVSPALLLGEDAQMEFFVDERLRVVRASSVIFVACALGTLSTSSIFRNGSLTDQGLLMQMVAYLGSITVGLTTVLLQRRPKPSQPA